MQQLAQKSAVCYKVKYIVIYVPVTSLIDLLLGKLIPLYTCMLSHFSCTRLFATLWTPLSMEFTRQEYWSGLHALFQRVFPTQGWKLHLISCLLHWQAGSLPPGKPHISAHIQLYRSVNTRLITTSQNSIPINKRMVKDGIYACSQLLCICINAAQIISISLC